MDRDPGEFDKRDSDASSSSDAQQWIDALSRDTGTADTPDALDAAIAEARADLAAGRGVPHAKVAQFLATWGTPDFRPMPAEWLR